MMTAQSGWINRPRNLAERPHGPLSFSIETGLLDHGRTARLWAPSARPARHVLRRSHPRKAGRNKARRARRIGQPTKIKAIRPIAAKPVARRGARDAPSAAYQESLRQTVQRRREHRARRQQNGGGEPGAPGAIVIWPMPPALIIRQTREVHGDVDSFLFGVRR